MRKATFIVALFFQLSGIAQSNAPAVINSSGGSAKAGYFQFEWSVGELALVNQMNSSGNTLIVTNGFLQPYILYPATNNPGNSFGAEEIKIFPVPAVTYLEVNFLTKQKGQLLIGLYDAAGKKVFGKELKANGVDLIEVIQMSQLAAGVYALKVELNAEAGYISKKGLYKISKIN